MGRAVPWPHRYRGVPRCAFCQHRPPPRWFLVGSPSGMEVPVRGGGQGLAMGCPGGSWKGDPPCPATARRAEGPGKKGGREAGRERTGSRVSAPSSGEERGKAEGEFLGTILDRGRAARGLKVLSPAGGGGPEGAKGEDRATLCCPDLLLAKEEDKGPLSAPRPLILAADPGGGGGFEQTREGKGVAEGGPFSTPHPTSSSGGGCPRGRPWPLAA